MSDELTLPWDVQNPFVTRVRVQAADVDRFGHTNNVVYLSWLERAAWAHSANLGLDFDGYQRLGCGCVVRRHELDYLAPTVPGQELWIGTWISENDGRLTMWRGYQIIRKTDRRTVLRARTYWVCVELRSGRPCRQPAEFLAKYQPVAEIRGDHTPGAPEA